MRIGMTSISTALIAGALLSLSYVPFSGAAPLEPRILDADGAKFAFTPLGLPETASGDTTWYGGTFWAGGDSNRFEAIRDSVWTFDTGVGSAINAGSNPNKPIGYHSSMEGWYGIDRTLSPLPYFRRSPTCSISGSFSLWAGVTTVEANLLCYATGAGYGNNWHLTVSRTFSYPGSGDVPFEFDYAIESEQDFDLAYVMVDTTGGAGGAPDAEVTHYSGIDNNHAVFQLQRGSTMRSTPGLYKIKFVVTSDSQYSDEDGLFPTSCGHSRFDNIAVAGTLSTFESGMDGWSLETPTTGVGDYTSLMSLADLPPPFGTACSVADSVLVFRDELELHPIGQDNMAASPWINLKRGTNTNDLGKSGRTISWDVYAEMPLTNYVFLQANARFYPQTCSVTGLVQRSRWIDDGILRYYGNPPFCSHPGSPVLANFSSFVPSTAEQIQIGFAVLNLCSFHVDCTEVSNTTPWVDNVRFGIYATQLPPTVATATPGCNSNTITWSAISGAANYRVKRDNVDISGLLPSTPTSFVDSGPGGSSRCYTVAGVAAGGVEGAYSSPSCATASTASPTVTNPSSQTVAYGGPATFQVTTTGNNLAFTWKKGGVTIAGAPNSNTYTIPAVTGTDAGSYSVQVCNPCGCVTSGSATLVVSNLPAPGGVSATAGCGSVSVTWNAVPGASGYRVKRDGTVISGVSPLGGSPFTDSSPGTAQRCYTVCTVDAGGNDGPYSAASCVTAPDVAPTATTPADQVALTGDAVTFQVTTTGIGLSYTWYLNNVAISGAPNGSSYTISSVSPTEAGTYRVQVCNVCGCVNTGNFQLTVCDPTTIAPIPATLKIPSASPSASLTATASGPGSGSVQWYRNGVALQNGPKYSGVDLATLTIQSPVVADGGYYELWATSGCEVVKSNTCLVQIVPCTSPPVNIFQQPTNQTAALGGSATFTIGATGCEAPTYQWQKANSTQFGTTWFNVSSVQNYTINPVAAGHKGTYRCIVKAGGSPVVISNKVTLNVVSPSILWLQAKASSCSTAVVSWITNVPTTGIVSYGATCSELQTPSTPLGLTGSTVITYTGQSCKYKLTVTNAQNASVSSLCQTAFFLPAAPNLVVIPITFPSYGSLSAPNDAVVLGIKITNNGCTPITGPITVTMVTVGPALPKKSGLISIDVPRTITTSGLAAGASKTMTPLMLFRRSEVGGGSGSTKTIKGTISYNYNGTKSVTFNGSYLLP